MAEPIFDATTERFYYGLPGLYVDEDGKIDYPLKRWLSGIGGEVHAVNGLIERFDYTTPDDGEPDDTSDLVDPETADEEWLPWLGQLVGLYFTASDSEATRRERISNAVGGIKAGTKTAIAEAVKEVLTGSKYVSIYAHSDTGGLGTASEWDVLIITIGTETLSDPIQAVLDRGAKPAGVLLHHANVTTTWADIEATFPTWADWEGKTWQEIEEAGL